MLQKRDLSSDDIHPKLQQREVYSTVNELLRADSTTLSCAQPCRLFAASTHQQMFPKHSFCKTATCNTAQKDPRATSPRRLPRLSHCPVRDHHALHCGLGAAFRGSRELTRLH